MAVPTFTMRQLLEAGVHFGHNTRRWNQKMEQYIFGVRNKVHIIDLQQTVPMLYAALNTTRDIAANGGRVLCVTALGDDLKQCNENAYSAVELIDWDGKYYRKDIGFRVMK